MTTLQFPLLIPSRLKSVVSFSSFWFPNWFFTAVSHFYSYVYTVSVGTCREPWSRVLERFLSAAHIHDSVAEVRFTEGLSHWEIVFGKWLYTVYTRGRKKLWEFVLGISHTSISIPGKTRISCIPIHFFLTKWKDKACWMRKPVTCFT